MLAFPTARGSDAAGIVVASQNLLASIDDTDRASTVLKDSDADILALQEYTPEWHGALTALRKRYPFGVTLPQPGAFGIALYSRIPLAESRILYLGKTRTPAIFAGIESDAYTGSLVVVHLLPPVNRLHTAEHRAQLGDLEELALASDGPLVIIGDFNDTPSAPTLRALMLHAKLDAAPPRICPTWPTLLAFAGIGIDLAVGSPGVGFSERRRLPKTGSDHRGFAVTLSTPADPTITR